MTRALFFILVCIWAPRALAGPDLPGALRTLVGAPLILVGDAAGGAGLLGAAAVASAGDLLGLLDDNPLTTPVLGGALSGGVQRLGLGLSNVSTGLLEGLRGEDVERLPEPPEHYLDTAAGFGRLDTALTGFSALRLAVLDTLSAPLLFGTQLVGAADASDRLQRLRRDARIAALGPEPARNKD